MFLKKIFFVSICVDRVELKEQLIMPNCHVVVHKYFFQTSAQTFFQNNISNKKKSYLKEVPPKIQICCLKQGIITEQVSYSK
jgi:hypothetical protein